MKRAITGGPHSGKTTYASSDAIHTDAAIALGWEGQSEYAAAVLDHPDGEIEGVAVTRGLRKWLDRNPQGKPVDEVVRMGTTHTPLSAGQDALRKGEEKVWNEIAPELRRRGVKIRYE